MSNDPCPTIAHWHPIRTGDPLPYQPTTAAPRLTIQEQLAIDPISKLAAAIEKLAAALEGARD